MSLLESARPPWPSRMLSVLRVVAAILFIEHGTQKVFGFPAGSGPHSPYVLMSLMGLAGLLETAGGFAILVGLFTRPIALLLCGEMAVAYFRAHSPRSLFPVINGGEPAVLLCFIFLYLAVAGGGAWSVDAVLSSARRARETGAR